jgi:hypothetical protein
MRWRIWALILAYLLASAGSCSFAAASWKKEMDLGQKSFNSNEYDVGINVIIAEHSSSE